LRALEGGHAVVILRSAHASHVVRAFVPK